MHYGRFTSLKAGVLASAAVGLSVPPADANAATLSFECVANEGQICVYNGGPYHIYRINGWYPGTGELVVESGLLEATGYKPDYWGGTRSRSNNGSAVTLDSYCEACLYHAAITNHGPGRHTIRATFYYNP